MLVEFMERGGLVCGWVMNPAGARGRLEVRMEGGRPITLTPARVVTRTEASNPGGNAAIDDYLAKVSERRKALADEVDLEELWESLDGDESPLSYDLLAGLNFGREAGPDDVSALIRAVHADGLWFEFSPEAPRRRDPEEIEKIRGIRIREAAKKVVKERGSAWLSAAVEGKAIDQPPEAAAVTACLKGFLHGGDDFKEASQAKELLRLAGLAADTFGAYQALCAVGEISRDEHVELARLGRPLDFSPAIEAEALALADGYNILSGSRLDLTSLFTATVDAPGAKEFDDSMSMEAGPGGTTILWLHIADPAPLVAPGSSLDAEARARAATIYLPETRYPMLPEVLTEKVMSLVKGLVRPALSLKIVLSPDGEPLSNEFHPSLVKVDLQISFTEAEAMLTGEGERCVLAPFLAVAKKLLARRMDLGGQSLKLPRGNVRLDAQGLPEAYLVDVESTSGLLVEEMMLLANHLAAKTLKDAGWPCPFRYQDKSQPRQWLPSPDASPRVKLAADLAARRLIGRVGVTLEPSAHHGVGLGVYTSFTSPMRRYLDLAVARQLRALISGGEPVYDRDAMMSLALDFEADYRAIRRLQNNRQRYWLMRMLAGMIGERFVGLVFERRGRKAKVCVTDYMLEFELPSLPATVEPGMDVLLRLSAAEPKIMDRPESLVFEYLQTL